MNSDIQVKIILCNKCINQNKFISWKKKSKIIIENVPHDYYVADLWYLNSKIAKYSWYKYALDIIVHFTIWYGGYLLKSKATEEVVKNIERIIKNLKISKIFQTNNWT